MKQLSQTNESMASSASLIVEESSNHIEKYLILTLGLLIMFISNFNLKAQATIEARGENADTAAFLPATSQGQNLDLAAVLSVFQNAKGLEEFEKELNKEDGINNLDLNGDSLVDYLRVMEKEEGEYRVIVLQAIIGENEFQDAAYINIRKTGDTDYEVQAEGNTIIYGDNYYVSPEPTVRYYVNLWPVWGYIYSPHYHYYYSNYYWGYYPTWYHRYYYRHYYSYYDRVVVYHHGYYYHHDIVVHRPHHIYTPRHSKKVQVTPAVKVGDRPVRTNQPQQPANRTAMPGTKGNVSRGTMGEEHQTAVKPGAPASRPAQEARPVSKGKQPAAKPAPANHPKSEARPVARPRTEARPTAPKQQTRPAPTKEQTKAKPAARPNPPAARPQESRKPAAEKKNAAPARKPAAEKSASKEAPVSR